VAKISHGVFIDLAPSCRCERRDFLRIPTIGVDLELGEARRTPIRPSATLGALIALLALSPPQAQEKSIVVASTISLQDPGQFGHILPLFKTKTGIDVRVVARTRSRVKIEGQQLFIQW